MDFDKKKERKGLIIKTWERCRSLGNTKSSLSPLGIPSPKSKSCNEIPLPKSGSWPRFQLPAEKKHKISWQGRDGSVDDDKIKTVTRRVTPGGCFSVYVGQQRQRFVIKTQYANHPLFKMLLEEAELEYGYHCEGPLTLPCNVDFFYRVLSEMEAEGDDDQIQQGCNFAKGCSTYKLLSPSRMVAIEY
ncbi:hypothetical protein C5167_022318 [Papaver somniferum]|uniref:Uncharacterized protein n=1 Tax=Papaver somniferum TaxID=3469 RepID=A0A4Y7JLD2_PAPSO|nr:auxin-responsive protein SAUR36-like [Papaver somniferum]RZC60559.1 hypothetical protein C5167_022318 [Papaver somniferum]